MAKRAGRAGSELTDVQPRTEGSTVTIPATEYLMLRRRYSLFWPKSKNDLLSDYPDLRKVKAFSDLNPRQMLFVWFYACRISPVVETIQDDDDRIKECIREAWGKNPPREVVDKYSMRQWGQEVTRAITAMRAYVPDARIRMKLLTMEAIKKVQALLDAPVDELVTWPQKKDYFEALGSGMARIKEMIPIVEENGLGVIDQDQIEYGDGEVMAEIMQDINGDES